MKNKKNLVSSMDGNCFLLLCYTHIHSTQTYTHTPCYLKYELSLSSNKIYFAKINIERFLRTWLVSFWEFLVPVVVIKCYSDVRGGCYEAFVLLLPIWRMLRPLHLLWVIDIWTSLALVSLICVSSEFRDYNMYDCVCIILHHSNQIGLVLNYLFSLFYMFL